MKSVIKTTIFLLFGLAMFLVVQEVVTPNWSEREHIDCVLSGYSLLDEGLVDAIIIGPSNMEYGISPMKMYSDSKIVSYNLGSSGQPIGCSYYMLKYALLTQHPKVAVLDVGALFSSGGRNSYWRYLLDNMPMSSVKKEMAEGYSQQAFSDGKLSVYFPIISYHTRWTELGRQDFLPPSEPQLHYAAGQYVGGVIKPISVTTSLVEEIVSGMRKRESGTITYYDVSQLDPSIQKVPVTKPVYDPKLSEDSMVWFEKIYDVCQENNIQLVLFKIPRYSYPQKDQSTWSSDKHQIVESLAEQYSLPFFDFIYDYEDRILDLATDTMDAGIHCNIRGADKITAELEKILIEQFGLMGKQNPQYDSMMQKYSKISSVAYLETETNLENYLDFLSTRLNDYTIYLVGSDEYTRNLFEEDYAKLRDQFCLKLFDSSQYAGAYIAVIDGGKVAYEAVSERRIDRKLKIDGQDVTLAASGWYTGPLASVKFQGKEYAMNVRGLNFVVVDKSTGLVIDSVSFNTYNENHQANRSYQNTNSYLRTYEKVVGFGGENV